MRLAWAWVWWLSARALSLDVAILLSGQLRGFIADDTWATWGTHVVDVLERAGLDYATYLCTDLEFEEGYINATVRRRLKIIMHDRWELLSNRSYAFKVGNWGMRRAQACYERCLESRSGCDKAQTLINSRPDVKWLADMPALSSVPPDHVGLRARTLVWQPGDAPFTNDHMEGKNCGVYPDRCATAIELTQRNGGAKCVNVDDQFAVIPAAFAPTFYARASPTEPVPHQTNYSHAFKASNWMINACRKECVRGMREGQLLENLAAHSTPALALQQLLFLVVSVLTRARPPSSTTTAPAAPARAGV